MDDRALSSLLRSFHDAPLPTKVLIAAAVYIASKDGKVDEEFLSKVEEAWARSIKAELDLNEIVRLYSEGWADYTSELSNYKDIARFVSLTLGEGLARLRGGKP